MEFLLDYENATNNLISYDTIHELKRYSEIIIFGAGDSGAWAYQLLTKYGIYPVAYCDNGRRKWGEVKNGLLIDSFENTISKYPNAAICVASMWIEEIEKQIIQYDYALKERMFNVLNTMAWETASKAFKSNERAYIEKNEKKFKQLYKILSDDKSRETLQGILNYRLTRKHKYLRMIKSNENVYLDEDILSKEQFDFIVQNIIVDGGAFDGDTIEYFIEKLGITALKIEAYEVEGKNIKILEGKLHKYADLQLRVYGNALWSQNGIEMYFEGDGLSGRCTNSGKASVQTTTIDLMDMDRNGKVGLIKLDIEGAEREALRGAENVIKRDHPILAVCAYHLQDDILELANIINEYYCGYRLYLRHYMLSSGDTIIYAIP